MIIGVFARIHGKDLRKALVNEKTLLNINIHITDFMFLSFLICFIKK